jgi:pyruvate kinase
MTADDDDVLVSVHGGEDHKTSPVITELRIAKVIIPLVKERRRRKRFRSMWGVIQLNLFM